jgi:hypothetical protein
LITKQSILKILFTNDLEQVLISFMDILLLMNNDDEKYNEKDNEPKVSESLDEKQDVNKEKKEKNRKYDYSHTTVSVEE